MNRIRSSSNLDKQPAPLVTFKTHFLSVITIYIAAYRVTQNMKPVHNHDESNKTKLFLILLHNEGGSYVVSYVICNHAKIDCHDMKM